VSGRPDRVGHEQLQRRVLSLVLAGDSSDLVRRIPASVERFFTTQVGEATTALRGRKVVVPLPEPDLAAPGMRPAKALPQSRSAHVRRWNGNGANRRDVPVGDGDRAFLRRRAASGRDRDGEGPDRYRRWLRRTSGYTGY
jgi:hypothetical protein